MASSRGSLRRSSTSVQSDSGADAQARLQHLVDAATLSSSSQIPSQHPSGGTAAPDSSSVSAAFEAADSLNINLGNVEKETKIRGTKAAKVALQALKRGQAAVTLEAKKPTSMRAASKLITTLSSFRTQGTPNRTKGYLRNLSNAITKMSQTFKHNYGDFDLYVSELVRLLQLYIKANPEQDAEGSGDEDEGSGDDGGAPGPVGGGGGAGPSSAGGLPTAGESGAARGGDGGSGPPPPGAAAKSGPPGAAAGLCLSLVKSGTAIIPRASSSPPAITGPATPDALSTTSSSGGGVEWRDLNHRVLLMSASDSSGESACKGAPEPCALPELRDTATSALRVVTLAVH